MAEDDFLSSLVKKALVSAASAAGSRVGGAAAAYVLDLIGLGGSQDLDEIRAELDSISAQVAKTDSKVSKLMDEIKWDRATDSFDTICAAIITHNSNLQTLLAIPDDATRDAQVRQYILGAHPSLDELDANLTLIDNRIMGKSGGLTGSYSEPLMQTYLESHWATVWDRSPAKCYQNILAVYLQTAQMQRLATSLLVAYREANGQPQLAAAAREHLETRLAAQFGVMARVAPDFIMLNSLETPGVRAAFTGLQIAPGHATISNGLLSPSQTPIPLAYWLLTRQGADPGAPTYTLSLNNVLIATEKSAQVPVDVDLVGLPGHEVAHYDYETAHQIEMASSPAAPLLFSIEATDQRGVLRLTLADGRTLGYIDRRYSGFLYELTSTEATSTNGLVTCTEFSRLPIEETPTLSAWSRTFQQSPAGEGRFTPGYRVRYRVSHLNRFGESDRSDWLLAPKAEDSQDSEGYFGNSLYYFPQIVLAPDPTGRTESYRIFRQFQGGPEEEVTATGTFVGDLHSGKPVIFDDFTP